MRAAARTCLVSTWFLLASSPIFLGRAQDGMPASNLPCRHLPIKYRIGGVDPRFGISGEEFRRLIEKAGGAWEESQKIFQYDPKGKLPINLVYDTRQKLTQTVIAIRASVAAKMAQADLIKEKLLPLRGNFRALDAAYAEQETGYKQAQDRYNREVKRSNLEGGATEAAALGFASERRSLQRQLGLLEAKRQELNHAADELNTLTKKRNALIELANAEAAAFNDSAPASMQFKEGRYVREGNKEWIDVFQFENTDHLLIILAHELGHALGIKHNSNPASIMSPLIHTDRLVLTAEDEDALKAACSAR